MRLYGRDRNHGEDPQRCVVEVSEPPYYIHSHQCSRGRGKGAGELEGLLCAQHARQHDGGQHLRVPADVLVPGVRVRVRSRWTYAGEEGVVVGPPVAKAQKGESKFSGLVVPVQLECHQDGKLVGFPGGALEPLGS